MIVFVGEVCEQLVPRIVNPVNGFVRDFEDIEKGIVL
jgi:hypothetical protein